MNQSITIVEMQERLEMIPAMSEILERQKNRIIELEKTVAKLKEPDVDLSVPKFMEHYDYSNAQSARKVMRKIVALYGGGGNSRKLLVKKTNADRFFYEHNGIISDEIAEENARKYIRKTRLKK